MADRLRVVIVEDDDVWADMARRALTATFDLDRASSLAELLEIGHVVTPAVVLLDLRLPDGGDFLSLVMKVCSRFPESAVIVTTSIDDEELALETLRAGAQDYIVKEVSVWATMGAKIRSAFARKRAAVREIRQAAENSMAAGSVVDTDKIVAMLEARLAERFKVKTGVHETVGVEGEVAGDWWRRITVGAIADLCKRNSRVVLRVLLALLAYAGAVFGMRESTESTVRQNSATVQQEAEAVQDAVKRIDQLMPKLEAVAESAEEPTQ